MESEKKDIINILDDLKANISKELAEPEMYQMTFNFAEFSEEEKNQMFDLAGEARVGTIAPDISDYVTSQNAARVALRKARDLTLGEKEWVQILKNIEKQGAKSK